MFFKILKILKTITLINKKTLNSNLLIFDCMSLENLEMHVLKGFEYFVISNRIEKIKLYLSTYLIIRYIKNYIKFFFNKELLLQDLYFLTLIDLIDPKIVLTAIDNHAQLSKITKYTTNKNIKFITLQLTSMMPQIKAKTYLFSKNLITKNLNQDLYFPQYLCFGKYIEELCLENKIKVDKFTHVGSLNLANFLKREKKNTDKKIFDVCLISDDGAFVDKYGPKQIQLDNIKKVEQSFIKLIKWTIQLCTQNKLRFNFVFKRRKENVVFSNMEKDRLKNNLTDNEYGFLLENSSFRSKSSPYVSYENVFQSKIGISVSSTLLWESIGCKNKILSCNFTGLKSFDFPIEGMCSLKECNYETFKNRVLKILEIDTNEYFKDLSRNGNYLISKCDPDQVINSIRNEINKNLM